MSFVIQYNQFWGLSTILRSKAEDDIKQYRELLDVIYRNAKRLQQLTEDILDVAKIESQNLILNKSQFNLKEVILNTIADIKTHLKGEGKDNKVILDFISNKEEDVFLYGDPGRITQVIYNFLSNAIKFTDEGIITIRMKRYGDNNNETKNNKQVIVVSIQDTG